MADGDYRGCMYAQQLPMCERTNHDLSRIPEEDFPICCDRCNQALAGLGDAGSCPRCGLPFVRGRLLWQTYGPEAFAEPPIREADRPENRSVYALLTGVALTLLLPAALLAWYGVFGKFDLAFALFAWAVVVSAMSWLVWSRRRGRREENNDEDDV